MSYILAQASAHALPLRNESVQCVVTSPPYWGLRAYAGEQEIAGWGCALGLEPTPELYVEHMVEVFREVRRVLRKDGTLWLNLGDSYATGAGSYRNPGSDVKPIDHGGKQAYTRDYARSQPNRMPQEGLKPKDLVGIPWRVAFALQADGWYLRSDIIWAKPNPMPESVTDRPTKSHEYLFLLTKSDRYYYDADAIREVAIHEGRVVKASGGEAKNGTHDEQNDRRTAAGFTTHDTLVAGRNARSVWNIATQPYPGAHFATFPEAIPERCIKAGSAAQACAVCGAPWERVTERAYVIGRKSGPGNRAALDDVSASSTFRTGLDAQFSTTGWQPTCTHDAGTSSSVVLDPFNGSGTTGAVALRLGRRYVGLDLSREYLTEQALHRVDPLAGAAQDARTGVSGQQVMSL